jgi:hypothetical protein
MSAWQVTPDVCMERLQTFRLKATPRGAWVDLRGYDSCVMETNIGTMATDGTFVGQLQESTDGTALTGTVSAGDLLGSFGAYGTANDPAIERVGYRGTCRYVRGVLTFTGTGAGAPCAVNIIRGHAYRQPLA